MYLHFESIEQVKQLNYLGIILDKKFKFKTIYVSRQKGVQPQ